MKALIQRVSQASVAVDGATVGAIQRGLLVLLGVEKQDDAQSVRTIVRKLLNYRVFPDQQGKMNLSVSDISASILLVSQFTLAAETRKGMRPGFSLAAEPEKAKQLFDQVKRGLDEELSHVETGVFGADMQVNLINDGPVTFLLEA